MALGSADTTRPVIGITGPDHGGLAAWLATAWAIRRAGGQPVRIRPGRPDAEARLHGLVIGGGADVSPLLYGDGGPATPLARTRRPWREHLVLLLLVPFLTVLRRLASTLHKPGPDSDRDHLENRLLAAALARGLPVLGICRGMQLLNVHLGGTLHRGLAAFYSEAPQMRSILPSKRVTLAADSHLAALMGRRHVRVNALHHQAIRELGEGLTVVGVEPNGVIQAIEDASRPYCVGVQWHPEYMPQRPEQRRLFRHLIAAAPTPPAAR